MHSRVQHSVNVVSTNLTGTAFFVFPSVPMGLTYVGSIQINPINVGEPIYRAAAWDHLIARPTPGTAIPVAVAENPPLITWSFPKDGPVVNPQNVILEPRATLQVYFDGLLIVTRYICTFTGYATTDDVPYSSPSLNT